jgi:hypothetical protein
VRVLDVSGQENAQFFTDKRRLQIGLGSVFSKSMRTAGESLRLYRQKPDAVAYGITVAFLAVLLFVAWIAWHSISLPPDFGIVHLLMAGVLIGFWLLFVSLIASALWTISYDFDSNEVRRNTSYIGVFHRQKAFPALSVASFSVEEIGGVFASHSYGVLMTLVSGQRELVATTQNAAEARLVVESLHQWLEASRKNPPASPHANSNTTPQPARRGGP